MHDIKAIRENPNAFDEAMKRRGLEGQAERVLNMDKMCRDCLTQLQKLQQLRNDTSRLIGDMKKAGKDASEAMEIVAQTKQEMLYLENNKKQFNETLHDRLIELPNILDDSVPDGDDEEQNIELRTVGTPTEFAHPPLDHTALGEGLGLMDFATAAKLSGARFTLLKGGLARLERALANFMLDTHCTEFGYTEITPPALVNRQTMQGTGQLPKFADDLFQTTDDRWLIPTAEVPLTNIVADSILNASDLPLRFTAYTPCFRAEAGAAGRDTRGMIRQHQFSKVELVSITHPDDSEAELERMTACAEAILQRLRLPYRVMLLCSGDTGFAAKKTYDIEVWLPGQNEGKGSYREISSCSTCGAFQARRMKARFRDSGEKETQFLHTLNGSGLAIGRVMIAILENFQRADGSIALPEALHPYMGGITELTAEKP